jgi:hypothetical protein
MSFPQSTLTTLTTLFHSNINISSQDYTENFLTNLPTHTAGFETALSGIEHLKSPSFQKLSAMGILLQL